MEGLGRREAAFSHDQTLILVKAPLRCRVQNEAGAGANRENAYAQICHDWRDHYRRCSSFDLPDLSKMVGRKEFIRVSGQGVRGSWKARHAGERSRCSPKA